MLRFIVYAVPLLLLQLALFGFAVELLDVEPGAGSVIRLALLEQPRVPGQLVLGTWLVEASGLIALFLLTQGRLGRWWLDGLVAGWVGWIFRGPLLVVTIVVAARQPQDPWWTLAFGWWVLYSACGLSLAILARRSGLEPWMQAKEAAAIRSAEPVAAAVVEETLVEPAKPSETMDEELVEPKGAGTAEEVATVESRAMEGPEDESIEPAPTEPPEAPPEAPPESPEPAEAAVDAEKV